MVLCWLSGICREISLKVRNAISVVRAYRKTWLWLGWVDARPLQTLFLAVLLQIGFGTGLVFSAEPGEISWQPESEYQVLCFLESIAQSRDFMH